MALWRHFSITSLDETFLSLVRPHFEDTFLSHHSTKHFYHLWDGTLKTLFYHITRRNISITCEMALWRRFSITSLDETFLSLVRWHFEDAFLSHHSTKHFYHLWDGTLKTLFYHITRRNISITCEMALWRRFSITSLDETFLSLVRWHFEDAFLSHHSTKHFYHLWDGTLKTLFYHITRRNISITCENLGTLKTLLFYHITRRNVSITCEGTFKTLFYQITRKWNIFLSFLRPSFKQNALYLPFVVHFFVNISICLLVNQFMSQRNQHFFYRLFANWTFFYHLLRHPC